MVEEKPASSAWSLGRSTSSKKRRAAAFSISRMVETLPLTSSSRATVRGVSVSAAKWVIGWRRPSSRISKSSLVRPLAQPPFLSRTEQRTFTKSTSTVITPGSRRAPRTICIAIRMVADDIGDSLSIFWLGEPCSPLQAGGLRYDMKRSRICWMLVCCTLAAQTPEPVPSVIPTLRITVTLVQVDAVVTDSSGRHVMDLGPGDFEILQDGEPRPITFFSRVPGTPPRPVKPTSIDGIPAPLTSTALTSAAQVKRAVALVVDDLALSFEDLVRTREALKRYVEQQMQPGDLVAVVRTGGGIAILEQFTTDKRLLLESIATLKWRFAGRQGLMALTPRAGSGSSTSGARPGEPEFLDYGYTLSALGALGTVEQVIEGMRKLPGRKSVVLLSDNLRVDGSIHSAIDHLTDLANRSTVSLYAIDPGGLRANMKEMRRDPVITAAGDATEMERFPGFAGAELDDETARQAGLEALASRTGGLFYRNRNDIEACIGEAADDQLGYYLLGYSPREGTFDTSGPAKFHRVAVRVARPGLKVRWKNGFTGVPDQLTLSEDGAKVKTREQEILEAMASPFAANGLKVRLTAMYLEAKPNRPLVHSTLYFEGKDVGFQQDPDGMWHASLDVVW